MPRRIDGDTVIFRRLPLENKLKKEDALP